NSLAPRDPDPARTSESFPDSIAARTSDSPAMSLADKAFASSGPSVVSPVNRAETPLLDGLPDERTSDPARRPPGLKMSELSALSCSAMGGRDMSTTDSGFETA